MALTADQVLSQVNAQINALETLSSKERQTAPSKHFEDNYNRLRKLSIDAMAGQPADRWPPELKSPVAAMGPSHSHSNYVEILGYLSELRAILAEDADDPMGGLLG